MATQSFLSEFPPISTEQWEHVIRENMEGAEYASKLIWHPEEGLAVKPYYRSSDLAGLQFPDAAPGEFPFARGTRPTGDWRIREEVEIADPEEANCAARAAVTAGAEEIAFCGVRLQSPSDLTVLLANLNEIPVHFEGLDTEGIRFLVDRLKNRPHGANVSSDLNPLANLDVSAEIIRSAPARFRPFVIQADDFQERAAGAIEEVGFALSAGVDIVAEMQARGPNVERVAGSLGFSFAVGPDFFLQIAKLRAFRMLWARVIESFGGTHAAGRMSIHVRTARWNKTIYDPQVNVLRATTEVISAIFGGADSISCAPFDECFRQPDENSRRLARNTQIMLKEEAMLSRVADPLGGAYLVEALTNTSASKAWKLFQELETVGGYREAHSAGVIESVLERRTDSRELAVARRRRVLTGTNRFANSTEKALGIIDVSRIDSVPRAASAFEELRLGTEQFEKRTGKQLCVLLAEIGDLKMRGARAQFAADFLASAGLHSRKQHFESAEQIASSNAKAIVLCSSDAEYLSIACELLPIIRKRDNHVTVMVAGNPDTADELRNIGIADFIHLRSNAVEVLSGLQHQIGIKD